MFNQALKSHYETITPLGRGGMGEVFLAAMPGPPGLNQLAVLKRIWPELAHEPEFVAMFMDEARLALRMRHENIVQTFEVGREAARTTRPGAGSEPDRYYIAMEYLAGQTLAQVTTRLAGSNAFGIQLRLQVVVDVLKALEYAHHLRSQDGTPLGVVHRDISPQNVFITYGGQVKLMDFGVAKSLGASHQTRPGTFKGRFAYAAPEQIRSAKVDRRSDLFSVGIILWELLTEQPLFRGRSKVDIVRILTGRQRLPALPADWPIPERLRQVIARALALQPGARYQSAAAFRQDLVDVQTSWLPPDPRSLGKVVSCAFQSERESIEKLIEHHFDVNEDAATRIPVKPRITLPQISMPALWPPGDRSPAPVQPAAAPPPAHPAHLSQPPVAQVAPRSVTPIPRPRERSVDRVPFLESAVVSLMTWHTRLANDTVMDSLGGRVRTSRIWRKLRRSRVASGAAGLCFGALLVVIFVRTPAGGAGAAQPAVPALPVAVSRWTGDDPPRPMVEPMPTAALPGFTRGGVAVSPPPSDTSNWPAGAAVRPMKTPSIIATSGLPVSGRSRPARSARGEAARPIAPAPHDNVEGATAGAEIPEGPRGRLAPAVAPATGRPTLDTENPWGP